MKYKFKKLITIIGILFICSIVFADSLTFDTIIYSVTTRSDFGGGLFPTGTRWNYRTDVDVFPSLNRKMNFDFVFDFSVNNEYMDYRFAWDSGTPLWTIRMSEYDWKRYKSIEYFNPSSFMTFTMTQGFGTDSLGLWEPMFKLRLKFNTRYAMALEKIDSSAANLIFVNSDGTPKKPFGPDSVIPAFPWLQDSRHLWNNRFEIDLDYSHMNYLGFNASDGVTANIHAEFGPAWFGNSVSLNGVTSDYWKVSTYLTQNLNLINLMQDNGLNWFSMNLSHTNSLGYIDGVVPEDRIPTDRFKGYFRDSLTLYMAGPQFIAWDCYTEMSLGLNNSLYFGHVVNEVIQESKGIELYSSIDAYFHLRLFGFIHFDYGFGYRFARGIWDNNPGWYQEAQLRFFISL